MEILVLYSWETDNGKAEEAKAWAMGLCDKLCRYTDTHASCDMLFAPQSDTLRDLTVKIGRADKILVIVSDSYNKKIEQESGVASYEEKIFRERIQSEYNTNNILFIKKENDVSLPIVICSLYERQ